MLQAYDDNKPGMGWALDVECLYGQASKDTKEIALFELPTMEYHRRLIVGVRNFLSLDIRDLIYGFQGAI